MAFWPFKRKRSHAVNDASQQQSSLSEKSQQPIRAATAPPSPATRRPSKKGSWRRRRTSHQQDKAVPIDVSKSLQSPTKDTHPGWRGSIEDITALPISEKLQQSPHLRPADQEKARIPYNFRPPPGSQTSVQWRDAHTQSPRPQTIQSKRSMHESIPSRRPSKNSTKSKRRDDAVREEQIRAMSAAMPMPKRTGEGPLRRESRKIRSLGRESSVSLPPEGSIHSAMSGVIEQRGFEVGSLAVFNPRPAFRLSGTPQYVSPGSLPNPSGFLYRIESVRAKEKDKTPATRDTERKRRTVGNEANDLDASDLRTILERDTKRRARRQQERQEKLERKLRARASKDQEEADEIRPKGAEEDELRAELFKARAEEERTARERKPPTAIHPAFRDKAVDSSSEPADYGIEKHIQASSNVFQDTPENPFTDAAAAPPTSPRSPRPVAPPLETSVEEDPTVETAKAVRLSQTRTPPLSPIYGPRSPVRGVPSTDALRPVRTADLPPPASKPPATNASETSAPISPASPTSPTSPTERRLGGWASIFRRGGTLSRKSPDESKSPTSATSFSNTSRESMANRPIPPHLIDTQMQRTSATTRSKSGAPVRTQSRFREDLPELPASPAEPRTQSPDVASMTAAAAVAAAARRGKRSQPIPIPGQVPDEDADIVAASSGDITRSPGARRRGLMSTSMASVDSEGSWLAGGAGSNKRQSNQSVLSRSFSQRRQEFSGSYEELGGDKDAEYITRNSGIHSSKLVNQTLADGDPDEESELGERSQQPLEVHGSVRRQPTLVQRVPRVKSREGLVAGIETAESDETTAASAGRESPSEYSDEFEGDSQLQSAKSVQYGSRHSRKFSAGSARLLDMSSPTRRTATPPPQPPS